MGRKPLIPRQGRLRLPGNRPAVQRLHMVRSRCCKDRSNNQRLTLIRRIPTTLLLCKINLKPTSRLNSSISGYGVGETVRIRNTSVIRIPPSRYFDTSWSHHAYKHSS